MAVDNDKTQLPDSFVPAVNPDGTPTKEWYEALQRLQEQVNAIQDEVDAQHP